MSVKEKVLQLCSEQGVKPGTLEREIKLSSGTISRWTNDTYPNGNTLSAMADFFGVTTDYLLERDEVDMNDELERLKNDPDLRILLSSSAKLNKNDLKFLKQLAARMNGEEFGE